MLVKEALISQGFFFAEVTSSLIENSNNTIDLIYDVEMGERALLKSIEFTGNKVFKTSKLRNIITSEDELYEALSSSRVKLTPEVKEVVNYRKSIFMGFQLIDKQGFLRVNDIIKIQKDLVDNDAGIRSTPGTVLKNDKIGEVVYTPPPRIKLK